MKYRIFKRLSILMAIVLVSVNFSVVAVDAAKPEKTAPIIDIAEGYSMSYDVFVGDSVEFNVSVTADSIRKLTWIYSDNLERTNLNYKTGEATFIFTSSVVEVISESIIVTDANGQGELVLNFSVLEASNHPPLINVEMSNLDVTTDEDAVTGGAIVADDLDEDVPEYSITTGAVKGTATINKDTGVFSYTPYLNENGTDQFGVEVSDGKGGTDSATVHITINAVDDPPEAVDDPDEETTVGVAVGIDVLTNDTDIDGGPMTIDSIANEVGGTASHDGTTVTFTPTAGAGEPAGFDYMLNGGSTAHVSVTITAAPTGPITYVALGDSIPYGQYYTSVWNYLFGGTDTDSYVEQFARYLGDSVGEVDFHDESVSGYHASEVLTQIGQISDLIEEADVITLSVGANDIMDAAPRGWGGLDKYNIEWSVADTGRDNFESYWPQVIDAVENLNPDVTLMVMTIYNPYRLSDSYYEQVEEYFSSTSAGDYGLNHIIEEFMVLDNSDYGDIVVDGFDYRVVDIHQLFVDEDPDSHSYTRFYESFCDPHPLQIFQNRIYEEHVESFGL